MDKDKIGYACTYQAPTGVGRNLAIQFNMEEAASKEDFDKKLDMLSSTIERQQAIGTLPKMIDEIRKAEEEIDKLLKQHETIKAQMADLELRGENYKKTHNGQPKTLDVQAYTRMQQELQHNWENIKKQEEGSKLLKEEIKKVEELR